MASGGGSAAGRTRHQYSDVGVHASYVHILELAVGASREIYDRVLFRLAVEDCGVPCALELDSPGDAVNPAHVDGFRDFVFPGRDIDVIDFFLLGRFDGGVDRRIVCGYNHRPVLRRLSTALGIGRLQAGKEKSKGK